MYDNIPDDDDLFSDNFVSARARSRRPLDERLEDDHSDNWRKPRAKRTRKNKKREAPVVNQIRDHLFKHYRAVTTRVNSGQWEDSDGNTIRGGEAGTSDILVCMPFDIRGITFGVYLAIECKAPSNKRGATPAQETFLIRVRVAGGYGIVAHSVLAVDEAIAAIRADLIDKLRRILAR